MKRPSSTQLTRPKQDTGAMILHVADVARLLNCSEKAIRRKVERRLIPFRRWGGRVIFDRASLMAVLNGLPGCSEEEARANLLLRSGDQGQR